MSGQMSNDFAEAVVQPQEEPRAAAFWQWLVLGLLVGAHGLFDALLTPFGQAVSNYPPSRAYCVIGVIIVQPVLFAMWAALHRQRFYQRFAAAGLAVIFVSTACGLGSFQQGRPGAPPVMITVSTTLVLFLLATLALWPVRLVGWQIRPVEAAEKAKERRGSHYAIKHLLVWTAVAAGLLGMARFLAEHGPGGDAGSVWRQPVGQVALSVAFFIVALFPTVAVPWITLAYRGHGKLLILAAVIAWGLLTYGCLIIVAQSPRITLQEIAQPVILLQLGASLAGFFSAIVVRFAGYRMARY